MPFKSEAQRRLAHAAAKGKSSKMSRAAGKKMIKHDKGGKLPKRVKRKKK